MDRSTTLTAHLARAAGTRAVDPVESAAEISATAALVADEDRRCAANVISGQRCRRLVAEGLTLCSGHIAMGTKVPSLW